ncbi:MAG: hypothetical protein HOP29_06120 [Phycisphaerales bacterium]|nr:hypothetical protein [Phycisphaerales bacterium]
MQGVGPRVQRLGEAGVADGMEDGPTLFFDGEDAGFVEDREVAGEDGDPIDESALEGKLCFAGLDLSTTTDLSALVLAFPHDDGSVTLLPRFWVPADNAEKRERRDRVPYQTWARQGFIEMTPGNVIDYGRIRACFDQLYERFNINEIAVDRWNATQFITQLTDEGYNVVPFGQGFKDMTAPTKELERLVISAMLRHGGNPVLRWMARQPQALEEEIHRPHRRTGRRYHGPGPPAPDHPGLRRSGVYVHLRESSSEEALVSAPAPAISNRPAALPPPSQFRVEGKNRDTLSSTSSMRRR